MNLTTNICKQKNSNANKSILRSLFYSAHTLSDSTLPSPPSQHRSISSSSSVSSWMDTIKGVFTGKKQQEPKDSADSFTLLRFADELKKARRVGSFKQYIVGRSSEATFSDAFEKMEGVIRYLSAFDPTGEATKSAMGGFSGEVAVGNRVESGGSVQLPAPSFN